MSQPTVLGVTKPNPLCTLSGGQVLIKRNSKEILPGSGAYAPGGSTVGNTILVRLELWDFDSI